LEKTLYNYHPAFHVWPPITFSVQATWQLGQKALKTNVSTKSTVNLPLTPFSFAHVRAIANYNYRRGMQCLYGIGDTVGAFWQSEVVKLNVCDWLTGKKLFGAMAYTKRQENDTMGAKSNASARAASCVWCDA